MVIVASRVFGATAPRAEATMHADVLIDLCARPSLLRDIAFQLDALGFDQPPPFGGEEFARCTFASARGQIDLLGPDDAGEGLLVINETSRTLAIPGGRRAPQVAGLVRLTYDEAAFDVDIRVPLLPGAIVVRAAAALDSRTRLAPHHAKDVAHMLGVLPDPISALAAITDADRELLAGLVERFRSSGDFAWRGMDSDSRLRSLTALELLL
jgi:hypothetical protein